ncbi:MAG: 7-cyano-7-deazaguanine synthase QueC [bacterium]|nr:7-cyano-7-deazaguanine synthase QueC [bacterium]
MIRKAEKIKKESAIVLVSGGMDSAVIAAIAIKKFTPIFLHFNYGQRTVKKELWSFNKLKEYYGVKQSKTVDIPYLKEIGASSLLDTKMEIPLDRAHTSKIPSTYVPFRNTQLLSIAVSWAESLGVHQVFYGANQVDSSGYPDCRENYLKAFNKLIKLGTKPESRIKITAPLIKMNKNEIVRMGIKLGVPFQYTWSCYKNTDRACGHCDSCKLRLKGFKSAGISDPIKYE